MADDETMEGGLLVLANRTGSRRTSSSARAGASLSR